MKPECEIAGCRRLPHRDLDICFHHKLKTIRLDPSATPSRYNDVPAAINSRRKEANSWERGIVKDERGMPLIGPKGYVRQKEWVENKHRYKEDLRRLNHEASVNQS